MIEANSYTQTIAAEPVTLTEAKLHLRVDISTDDDLITALIQAARETCETYLQKAVPEQTVVALFDKFGDLRLPLGAASSITSIAYLDGDGASQTMSLSPPDYLLSNDAVYLKQDGEWPATRVQKDAVTVTYAAGYSVSSPDDVPARIKQAMLLLIGDLYENREAQVIGVSVTENKAVERLLYPLRRLGM